MALVSRPLERRWSETERSNSHRLARRASEASNEPRRSRGRMQVVPFRATAKRDSPSRAKPGSQATRQSIMKAKLS
ncbi:MAG TPA: hypothetical protein DIC26_14545 [Pseudomonas sp.]|nr:hypothetical protein [Pseudomonas sp.]